MIEIRFSFLYNTPGFSNNKPSDLKSIVRLSKYEQHCIYQLNINRPLKIHKNLCLYIYMCVCVCVCVCVYTHTHIYIYIYIYIEREREREI